MMKRTLTALLAAMLLAGVLSGCSGSVYYDDPMPDRVAVRRLHQQWPGGRHRHDRRPVKNGELPIGSSFSIIS